MSDSASFNMNYKVLKDTADWLSKQEEPDIDQLVPRVEEAMQAYQVCKERLDMVKETLGKYLQPESMDGKPVDGKPTGDGNPF